MKVQLGWLKEHVDLPESETEIAERLTSVGLAVEDRQGTGDDTVFELDVTSNRVDAMNHVGVARELAAAFGRELRLPEAQLQESDEQASAVTSVTVQDPDLCPRYAARVVRGVTVGPSPDWMARRLEAIGLRPINVLVDVTNYVLMELGHPLHAFDLSLLDEERIVVRRATEREVLETLDGEQRDLTTDMLLIADAGRGVAVAGVMGGANTEIRDETTDVLLESAWFLPRSVRRTARRLGMHTDASHRFERGADLDAVPLALDRAAQLVAELAGGQVLTGRIDVAEEPAPQLELRLRHAQVARIGGVEVARSYVDGLLPRLGFEVLESDDESWTVRVPRRRGDVSREVDLVEEVLRHHGFDRVPATLPAFREGARPRQPWEVALAALRQGLVASGYHQAVSFSFGDPADHEPFAASVIADGAERAITVANPIAENLSRMRTSLVPGLLRAASTAVRRDEPDVRLFEEGKIFLRPLEAEAGDSPAEERWALALVGTGRSGSSHHSRPPAMVDLLTTKGVLFEALGAAIGESEPPTLELRPAEVPHCAPGAAEVWFRGGRLGWVGRLHPEILEPLEIESALFAAEVDLTSLFEQGRSRPAFKPISRYPRMVRDVSVLVDRNLHYGDIIAAVRDRFGPLESADSVFESIGLIDRYVGKGVPDEKVSLTLSVSCRRQDRTLRQDEVDELHGQLVELLASKFGATLRA